MNLKMLEMIMKFAPAKSLRFGQFPSNLKFRGFHFTVYATKQFSTPTIKIKIIPYMS